MKTKNRLASPLSPYRRVKRFLFSLGCIVLCAVVAPACATIFSKSKYEVAFSGNPEDAVLRITDPNGFLVKEDTLPYSVTLNASSGIFSPAYYDLQVKHPDYQTSKLALWAKLDAVYFLDIIPLTVGAFVYFPIVYASLAASFIDPLTGAMWALPRERFFTLEKKEASIKENGKLTLKLEQQEKEPPNIRSGLEPIEQE